MKTRVHLYPAEFFLEWEMFQTKVEEKIRRHFMLDNVSSENRAIFEPVWQKYGTAGQATDDITIRRMRLARWMTKATDTHSEYVILIVYHSNNDYAIAPQCYVYTYIACLVDSSYIFRFCVLVPIL